MASLHRTIARNIARERMISAGVKHPHRKGYAIDPKVGIKRSKAFKQTITSLFALNWRKFLPGADKAKRTPRETRTRMKSSKGGSIA